MNEQSECAVCGGALWLCEDHADKPWGGASNHADACHCGGAGVPCLACNRIDREHPPKMPDGYKTPAAGPRRTLGNRKPCSLHRPSTTVKKYFRHDDGMRSICQTPLTFE